MGWSTIGSWAPSSRKGHNSEHEARAHGLQQLRSWRETGTPRIAEFRVIGYYAGKEAFTLSVEDCDKQWQASS